jgi:uncharacterized protein (DUF362 family)
MQYKKIRRKIMGYRQKPLTRREILRWLMLAGAGSAVAGCSGGPSAANPTNSKPAVQPGQNKTGDSPDKSQTVEKQPPNDSATSEPVSQPEPQNQASGSHPYLTVARGEDPAVITGLAIKALGGMERFVKDGYDVIIKPNICTDNYPFEYAATTNPVVVAALVKLALGAGAKRVRVMDYPFGGTPASAYAQSGIADAVKAAGGEMEVMNPNKFRPTDIPQGKSIQKWEIYQDALNCDLLINVPIAKHHSLARLTLGGKNLLGLIQKRGSIHAQLGQRVADLISVIQPGLTVVDAVRCLMDHGPTGGNLNDVRLTNTIIASQDIVAADSYATGLFDKTGNDIAYIRAAAEMGLGTMDLSGVKVEEISA